MLEDEKDRIERFAKCLCKLQTPQKLLHARTANRFIELYLTVSRSPDRPGMICLDHDLFVENESDPDPGDGRDVAKFLSDSEPICPVLIHSTNSVAADAMLFRLLDAGWIADRIAPIGSDWIESYWFPYMKNYLSDK